MIRCAMDTGGGSLISPLATLARMKSIRIRHEPA
jgi:hypothetical protein